MPSDSLRIAAEDTPLDPIEAALVRALAACIVRELRADAERKREAPPPSARSRRFVEDQAKPIMLHRRTG